MDDVLATVIQLYVRSFLKPHFRLVRCVDNILNHFWSKCFVEKFIPQKLLCHSYKTLGPNMPENINYLTTNV